MSTSAPPPAPNGSETAFIGDSVSKPADPPPLESLSATPRPPTPVSLLTPTQTSRPTPTPTQSLRRPRSKPKTEFLLPAIGKPTLGYGAVLVACVAGLIAGSFMLVRTGLMGDAFRAATCTEFGPKQTTVTHNGLSVQVAPEALLGRFGVMLDITPISPETAAKLSSLGQPQSNLYTLKTCSVLPQQMTLSVDIPPQIKDVNTLDLYGWDGAQWNWLGGKADVQTRKLVAEVKQPPQQLALLQITTAKPIVGAELAMRDANTGGPVVALPADLVKEIVPSGLYLGDFGELAGDRTQIRQPQVGVKTYPAVRNWGSNGVINRTLVQHLLQNTAARSNHIANLTQFAVAQKYDGIAVDYRGVSLAQRDDFTEFMRLLAGSLHASNKRLIVVVPAPERTTNPDPAKEWDEGAYNLPALSAIADQINLDLCYEPEILANNLDSVMQWAISRINRQKLQVGLPSLSVRQGESEAIELLNLNDALGNFSLVGHVAAPLTTGAAARFTLKVDGSADVAFDASTQTYHFTTLGLNGKPTTVWLGTSASLRHRLQQIEKYRVRGVTMRGLMSQGNDSGIPHVLGEYQAQTLNTGSAPASLQVRVQLNTLAATRTPNDAVVNGTTIDVQMPQEPGEYSIQTTVNGTTVLNTQPAQVQVAAPTKSP